LRRATGAARPIFEADRHAKVALKKPVRGVRPIERELEGQEGEEAEAVGVLEDLRNHSWKARVKAEGGGKGQAWEVQGTPGNGNHGGDDGVNTAGGAASRQKHGDGDDAQRRRAR